MKKIISMFLVSLMLLSLCACGSATAGEASDGGETRGDALQVGFGKVNITPDYSVGLGGSGNDKIRRSTGLISYVFAICVALRQNGDLYLMYTVDTLSINDDLADIIRQYIKTALPDIEIKAENIYLAATHSHSCPTPYWPDENEGKYRAELMNWLPQAAKLAIEDLAPATMEVTQFDLEGMNFVRHYIMNDGTYAGSNFGNTQSGYKAHTYEVDHEMILVNFPREGKKNVLLVNWAAHPANPNDPAIGYLNISADHPGWCRDKLEQLTGAKVAYFNGASGDVVPNSKITEINHGLNAKEYGERLAEMAFEHYETLKPVEIGAIKTTTRDVELKVEHELEHLVAECVEIKDLHVNQGQTDLANQKARALGLSSCFHASSIIARAKLGPTQLREVNAIALGPVGFVTCTYEMASGHADELKAAAPFSTVFIMSGNQRYIPREEAIDYHSYEGDTRYYTRDAGDYMVAQFLEMLNEVK